MKTSGLRVICKNNTAIRRIACFLAALFAVALIGCKNEITIPSATTLPAASPTAAPSETWHWTLEDGWRQSRIEGETVLEGIGHSWATLEEDVWTNVALSAQVKITSGTVHLNVRRSESEARASRYFIGVNQTSLYLDKQVGEDFTDLAVKQIELDDGWHAIEIKACGALINVSLDGVLYIVYEDEAPLSGSGVALETLEDSSVQLRALSISQAEANDLTAPSIEEKTLRKEEETRNAFLPDETHEGDLILSGSEELTIENEQYLQLGNVYLNDQSKLIIRDATFMLGRGDVPTVHVYINVAQGATLLIERSTIIEKAEEGAGMLIVIRNHGITSVIDSPTEIHLLEQYEGSVEIQNSQLINEIGGLLQVSGGSTTVTDSTLGALGFSVPADASLTLDNLHSGVYLENWNLQDWLPEAGYSIAIQRSTILEDNLEPGPFERGWLLFPDEHSQVRLSNSEMRKVFFDVSNETAEFDNLRINEPTSLRYKDIVLENVTMTGQWPITVRDSDVTIRNSNYLFLQPSGTSNLTLIDSHVVEFIPREFYGSITFENGTWTNAGEIIGGEDYHSAGNDFTIAGSLTIGPEVRQNLQWKDARVTREYTAVVTDQNGNPLPDLTVTIEGQSYMTDESGTVVFSLIFDKTNYNQPMQITLSKQNQVLFQNEIDFFTATPIQITIQE